MMRKVLFLIVVLSLLPATAWSQDEATTSPADNYCKQPGERALSTASDAWELQPEVWTQSSVQQQAPARKAGPPARGLKAGQTLLYAEYYDTKTATRTLGSHMDTIFTAASGNTAQLNGLYVWANKMKMTYTDSTVSIPVQAVYNHPTYGLVYVCPVDWDKKTYSTTQPLTGTIDADGNIRLGGWGLFLISGEHAGGSFGAFTGTSLMATNAVMTNVYRIPQDSVETYPVYIEQPYDNQISIVNFADNGTAVAAYVNPDKSVEITPQHIYTNPTYGEFMCYPANWATTKYPVDGSINGTATATQINLGNWGIFCRVYRQLCPYPYVSSQIVYPAGTVTFPTAKTLDWSGTGTAADPYLVTNADQLQGMAESVNYGTSYAGKYIALGNDIDMSRVASVYRSAGHSKEKSFQGNFDGRGFTIKNLKITFGQESYAGVFGYVGDSATLKNVKIDSLSLTSYGMYAGGLVGYSCANISNVAVTHSTINHHNSYGGGIVGYLNRATVADCSYDGTMTVAGASGGIAGYLYYASVKRCNANMRLTYNECYNHLLRSVGGLVGYVLDSVNAVSNVVSDSYAAGTYTVGLASAVMGGLIGNMNGGHMERCYSTAAINAAVTNAQNGSVGGLVGMTYGAHVNDCYTSNELIVSGSGTQAGGLVGYMLDNKSGNTVLENCLSTGQVIVNTLTGHEGLWGVRQDKNILKHCYYDRQITNYDLVDSLSSLAAYTRTLTSGEPLEGYSTSVWTFKPGLYPQLTAFAGTALSHMSASPVTLAGDETTRKVKSTFTVSTQNDMDWYVYENGELTKTSTGLVINDSTVTLKNVSVSAMLAGTCDGGENFKFVNLTTVNPNGFVGSGTESDPYLIQSKEDLIALNAAVTSKTAAQSFSGDYFKQTNDIDCKGSRDFQGVGSDINQKHTFDGIYDGGGYTIHNFVIDSIHCNATGTAVRSSSRRVAGLFGYCNSKSVIKNVTLASDCKVRAFEIAGGIAAVTLGRIENCRNYADVTTVGPYAAGIVAQTVSGSTVTNCYNAGTITSGSSVAGGIVAVHSGTVEYCQNDGEVRADSINPFYAATAQHTVGGIAASVDGSHAVVHHNVNTGYVHTLREVGGITAGAVTGAQVRYNLNYGMVDCYDDNTTVGTVAGTSLPEATCKDNYYDRQITRYNAVALTSSPSCQGVNTATLTSGTALDSLDASHYDWQAGMYPVIASFKNEPAAMAHRRMVVTLSGNENIDNMRTTATLNRLDGMTWKLSRNTDFTIADGGVLSVALKADTVSMRDTLTVTYNGYNKVLPLRAIPRLWQGDGTAQNPYQIKTVADMNMLSHFTTSEQYPFTGDCFKVMNDIDFSSQSNFVPVADAGNLFDGDFDGNGMKLSHLTINHDENEYQALFGAVGANGSVHDLTLADVNVTGLRYLGGFAGLVYGKLSNLTLESGTLSTPRYGYAGGIAYGLIAGGMIKNCVTKSATGPKSGDMAGIVGEIDERASVIGCTNYANISNGADLGGIAYMSYGTIRDCVNHGNINGTSYLGGIVAVCAADSIVNCVNYGNVTGTGSYVGGVIGRSNSSEVTAYYIGCHNEGDVSGSAEVGGFVGYMLRAFDITDCYNTGAVSSTGNECGGFAGCITYSSQVSNNEGTLSRCYNTGLVTGGSSRVGGFVGNVGNWLKFDSCYNTGYVLGDKGNYVGGFVGYSRQSGYTDCWNAGIVEGSGYCVAGFAGYTQGLVSRCANVGNVTCTSVKGSTSYGNASGLVAYGGPKIWDCYNMGDITGPQLVSGLISTVYNSSTDVHRAYSAGDVTSSTAGSCGAVSSGGGNYKMHGLDSVYYDREAFTGTLSATDAMATGLTTRQLALCDTLGSAFAIKEGFYPTLASQADNAILNFYAAIPMLGPGETRDNVQGPFILGTPEGTTWTATPAIVTINGNQAIPTATGEVTLTKTMGDYSKSYKLKITGLSGVNDVTTDSPVVGVTYYDLQGRLATSTATGVLIKVTRYQNGTTTATRIMR